MKRVGILTLHYSDNYGAVLQAYALRRVINQFSGFDARLINYVPDNYEYPVYGGVADGYEKMLEKRSKFENFMERRCGLDTPIIQSVTGNDYDYYCVGSDQVWNLEFASLEYFLPNIDASAKRIAYAASIGMRHDSPAWNSLIIKKYLPAFKNISLREAEDVKIVSELSGKRCECVLDPTLLLPGRAYDELICTDKEKSGDYIFLFWLNHDLEYMRGVELANTISRKYNIPVIHSFSDAPAFMFADDGGSMIYSGIEEFLWYIKNAKYVVTNSYHATLFSIQLETPFYTFPVHSMGARTETIKNALLIQDRIADKYLSPDDISDNVDFVAIHERIEIQKRASIEYLRKALDIEQMG